jgi:N-acetyl-anhydromuramoyl-L-alanine amidase
MAHAMASSLSIAGDGWAIGSPVERVESPNQDERAEGEPPWLVVVHNISLPPGTFGGRAIDALFTNTLDPDAHPYFRDVAALRVSAHFVIGRDGALVQFVSCERRAWHAGVSSFEGRTRCNDFSIGIELEGDDVTPFEDAQYACLTALVDALAARYPIAAIAGHSDVAPGRKTDPGPCFDWSRLLAGVAPTLRRGGP